MSRLSLRLVQLNAGLFLYGFTMAMLVESTLGLDPWDVLHEGIDRQVGLTFGQVVIAVGAAVLLLWIPLRQKPGVGTVLNVIVIGLAADFGIAVIDRPDELWLRIALLVGGVIGNGFAGALYIGAALGAGPRDGLWLGLVWRTGLSVRLWRTVIEVAVVVIGFALGGTVGVGTILYALTIGPLVQLFLRWTSLHVPPSPPRRRHVPKPWVTRQRNCATRHRTCVTRHRTCATRQRRVAMMREASTSISISTAANRSSVSQRSRTVSTRPSTMGGQKADGTKSSSTAMPPGSSRRATTSMLSMTSRMSMNSSENGAYCSSVDQSPAITSTLSVSAKIFCTSLASLGSSSALTTRASLGAPLDSHAEPTPQPVPSSASVPVRDAASAASRRPVSLRIEVMKPRCLDRSNVLETSSGTSAGALTRTVFHDVPIR
jgi:uncharacterized membrane protein YczE